MKKMQEVLQRSRAALMSDLGDVPGWVLVTVMTAGLVTGLWLIADGQLQTILTRALNNVSMS